MDLPAINLIVYFQIKVYWCALSSFIFQIIKHSTHSVVAHVQNLRRIKRPCNRTN